MNTFRMDDSTIVSTGKGKVQGYYFNGVNVFKGIPYADAERYQLPHEVDAWDGVKDCTSYGRVCPLMHPEIPSGEVLVPHRYWPTSEHCLYLNVWSTKLCSQAKKPVMVWLHGGGFSAGSSIEQACYEGENMAKNGDVVVVSVNHRLNILGYLDLSPFGEKYKNSGNIGNEDMVAALRWVHENIENFGGDPENVTIFGQSGGGMKVTSLMQMPEADGLFQKGIVMSGVMDRGILGIDEGDGTEIVTAMLKNLGLTPADVEQLETMPYEKMVDAYEAAVGELREKNVYAGQMPIINDYYAGQPQFCGFTENAKKIPLMVGSVFGEFAFMKLDFDKRTMSAKEIKAALTAKFGDKTDGIVKEFKKAFPEKNLMDLLSYDTVFRSPSKDLIAAASEREAPVYSYLFAFEFPVQNNKPAWHCSDIPFAFDNIDLVPSANVPGVSDKLQEQYFGAYMAFAKTGDPNIAELPEWKPCKPGKEYTMIFDRTCRAAAVNFDNKLQQLYKDAIPPFSLYGIKIEH